MTGSPPTAAANAISSDLRGRYQRLQLQLDQEAQELIAYWLRHGVDTEFGGFHGQLNREGDPEEPSLKGLIQQSRHLWTLAMWSTKRAHTPAIDEAASATYRFLMTHFLDDDGEFFFEVNRQGDPTNKKKQIYAESFAIFALAEYSAAVGSAEARQAALRCFRSLDARAHDDAEAGYDQTDDPGFLVSGAQKGTNTHIHLLEAYTSLLRLTDDALVAERLTELIDVVAFKIIQPAGYAHMTFLKDWQPCEPIRVSYGHDLETFWLVRDALAALRERGRLPETAGQVSAVILQMAKNSADWGYDAAKGGYFEEGQPALPQASTGQVILHEKVWWVQAEAIAGLWWTHILTGEEKYLSRLEHTLQWVLQSQKDNQHGSWYWGIEPDGAVSARGSQKGELWKTSYHDIRALVFTSDWITQHLKA